jgi:hypothetical protein
LTSDLFSIDVVDHFRTRELITRPDAQKKYAKSGEGEGAVYQCGLSLAPARESVKWNLCAGSSKGCRAACLITAGSNVYGTSARARILRTRLLMEHPEVFLSYLQRDLDKAHKTADKLGLRFAFRFNTLSDVDVMRLCAEMIRPEDIWLDYTKVAAKYRAWLARRPSVPYHLTFSRSETNEAQCLEFLKLGGTVTLVIRDQQEFDRVLRLGYQGFPAVNGDLSDRRWNDPAGHWVALIAKGKARKDATGFALRCAA